MLLFRLELLSPFFLSQQHLFPIDELGLDDETVDLLKSGKLNVRLICEMIKHPDFINFLSDMEIYFDNLSGMQFRNINKMIEQTRVRLQNKGISDENHYMKTLEAATISEDNYFNNLLGNDVVKIAKDKEMHIAKTQKPVKLLRLLTIYLTHLRN